jgi:hypothetical protein
VVHLTGLTRGSLDTYSQIEKPDNPLALYTADTAETYNSIGAFYRAIEAAFDLNASKLTQLHIGKQIYYNLKEHGAGNEIIRMKNVKEVKRCIKIIMEQGEGTSTSPENPHYLQTGELSHYYAFREYYHGRKLKKVRLNTNEGEGSNYKWEFSGEKLPMPKTYAVAEVPAGGWPRNNIKNDDVTKKLNLFNRSYSSMLDCFEKAWKQQQGDSQDELVSTAIAKMKSMGQVGRQIMKFPLPDIPNVPSPVSSGWHYCPEFLFVPGAKC